MCIYCKKDRKDARSFGMNALGVKYVISVVTHRRSAPFKVRHFRYDAMQGLHQVKYVISVVTHCRSAPFEYVYQ